MANKLIDLGIENGLHTWQVVDEVGNIVGYNQGEETL